MKQLIQHLQSGKTTLEEVPIPAIKKGYIVVQTTYSLVSTGTEKMLVEFSKANLINKVRQNPDRVEQVFNKIASDGLLPTLEAVFRKLDEPLPLGYCNLGTVVGIGEGVTDFKIGDRVISNGAHAEYVSVPQNLACSVPENVTDEAAVFTVVGAIGLEAIRLANPQLGETVCVIGLGLIGLLTCQLLQASGCRVIAFDIDESKIAVAKSLQIHALNSSVSSIDQVMMDATRQVGADAVFIAASAKNDNLVNIAAKAVKKRGKIILIGVTDLHLDRTEFYKKEISFQVSCSYGAGRYDEQYEMQGIDYPEAYVKWTAKRNFEAVLHALSANKLAVAPLINEIVPFENAPDTYNAISTSNTIATILQYSRPTSKAQAGSNTMTNISSSKTVIIGIIGAGNFAKASLVPTLKKLGSTIKSICGNDGLSAAMLAKKYQIPNAVSDVNKIIDDPEINLVIIATRHDSHAALTEQCLLAGKHVFVEKPLAINVTSLETLKTTLEANPKLILQCGFNRRFAPLSRQIKSQLPADEKINIVMTINAGSLPSGHWLNDKTSGGGRIVGEACHFFDLMCYFTGSSIQSVYATEAPITNNTENTIIHLQFTNGSHGTINYFSNGHKKYPKETIEIFAGNKVFILDNFRKVKTYGTFIPNKLVAKQDKGHKQQFETLFEVIQSGKNTLPTFQQLYNITKATLLVETSITSKLPQEVN